MDGACRARERAPRRYQPRRPSQSALYRCVQELRSKRRRTCACTWAMAWASTPVAAVKMTAPAAAASNTPSMTPQWMLDEPRKKKGKKQRGKGK